MSRRNAGNWISLPCVPLLQGPQEVLLWGYPPPTHRGVCGQSQSRELAPWTSWECLWPLRLPWSQVASGLRDSPRTKGLDPSPLDTARDRADPREQEVRDGERESESQQPRWPEQGAEAREARRQGSDASAPVGTERPKSGIQNRWIQRPWRSPPLPGPRFLAAQGGDHGGDT